MYLAQNAEGHHAKLACYLCLNPNLLVDTGQFIEGEGVLAICASCTKEMADTAGIRDETCEDDVKTVADINTRLADQLAVEKALVVKLRKQIKTLKAPADVD